MQNGLHGHATTSKISRKRVSRNLIDTFLHIFITQTYSSHVSFHWHIFFLWRSLFCSQKEHWGVSICLRNIACYINYSSINLIEFSPAPDGPEGFKIKWNLIRIVQDIWISSLTHDGNQISTRKSSTHLIEDFFASCHESEKLSILKIKADNKNANYAIKISTADYARILSPH